jgi:hypothetical protein
VTTFPDRTYLPRRVRQLCEALDQAGWRIEAGRFPGNYRADHPRMADERPIPEYMRGSRAWPFDTYTELRQLWFNIHDGRLTFIQTRTGVPWVAAQESTVTLPRALAYIQQPWPT